MKNLTLFILFALLLVLVGCSREVATDGTNTFVTSATVPYDRSIYTIRGLVVSDVTSMSRQSSGGQMELTSYPALYASGSYYSETTGKGFVRVKIGVLTSSIQPMRPDMDTALGRVGDTVILKTTDAKIQALLPGDVVQFKCRADFELLGAVTAKETLNQGDVDTLGTWEFDLCRLVSPVIGGE